MSAIDQIITVQIQAASATPSLPGFGIPAILAYHTHNPDKIRTYFDLDGLVSDGFSTTEPAYLMAQSIVQQNPRPSSFKIIRGTTPVPQTFTFQVTDTQVGDSIGLVLMDPSGSTHPLYHTAAAGETATQIAAALATLAGPLSGVTAVAATDTLTFTVGTAGSLWYPSAIQGGNFTDTTISANPQNDLGAALLVDNSWYGVSGEWLSAANVSAIAAWTEANNKIHAYTTADSANLSPANGITHTLQLAGYKRTYGQFSGTPSTYGAVGLLANRLTADPGSDTWAYKSIAGTAVDSLTPTQTTNLTANNGNFYISVAGVNTTLDGRSAQGLFMDITRGIDALTADIQVRVFNLLVSLPKLPYTRKGIAAVGAEVGAALQGAVRSGFLSNDSGFEPQVILPDLTQVSPIDKKQRILRNVQFVAFAQGAVHKVQINGTVNI